MARCCWFVSGWVLHRSSNARGAQPLATTVSFPWPLCMWHNNYRHNNRTCRAWPEWPCGSWEIYRCTLKMKTFNWCVVITDLPFSPGKLSFWIISTFGSAGRLRVTGGSSSTSMLGVWLEFSHSYVLQFLNAGNRSEYRQLSVSFNNFSFVFGSKHLMVRRCVPDPQAFVHCMNDELKCEIN